MSSSRPSGAGPDSVAVLADFAWFLSTYPSHCIRDGKRGVQLAEKAVRLAGAPDQRLVTVLAAAYAESGDFDRATHLVQAAAGGLPFDRAGALNGLIANLRGREPIRDVPTFR